MSSKWNSDQYFEKAARYLKRSVRPESEDGEKAFWSTLALEQLSRAALCHVSPVLNADPQEEGASIMFALGFEGKKPPKTIPMHAVTARLELVLEEFTADSRKFCEGFMFRRNEEVHDSSLPFDGLPEGSWLTQFYVVCKILCDSISKTLDDLLGAELASAATQLIDAHKEDVHAKVKELVKNHRAVFSAKPPDEQKKLSRRKGRLKLNPDQSTAEFECPACSSSGRLIGTLATESEPYLRNSGLFLKRTYNATSFVCPACGLGLLSVAYLMAAKAEPTFEEEVELDLHDVFQMDYEEDYFNM